jgi:hypothetical protein
VCTDLVARKKEAEYAQEEELREKESTTKEGKDKLQTVKPFFSLLMYFFRKRINKAKERILIEQKPLLLL